MNVDTSKLDLSALRIFLEVYRAGSITAASESLNMTQPGVSTALKRLQKQLGVTLFARHGRSIIPTQKGTSFAEQIQNSLTILDEAVGSLHAFSPIQERMFKLMVNEAMLNILQPAIDKDKTLQNVQIELHPLPVDENSVEELLSLSQFDLAIDIYSPQSSAFSSELLYSDDFILACNKNHPRIGDTISQETYLAEKHISIMLRRGNLSMVQKFTPFEMPARKISTVCNSLVGALYLASISENICTSSRLLTNQVAEQLPLKCLDFPFEAVPIEHNMIWHKRNQNTASNVWLRQKIKSYLEAVI